MVYFTLGRSNSVKQLADSGTTISNWFSISDDMYSDDPFSGVFNPEFDYHSEEEAIIKSSYLVDMLNGASILLGTNINLQLDLIISENVRIGEFNDYSSRISIIKNKVFDVDYDRTIFKNFMKRGRLDLALVYLSNFDHYCRYFLYILSKSKVDFISLYKIWESLEDRHNYFCKLYKPKGISQIKLKIWLNNLIFLQKSELSIINAFTKFANHYVYVGQISRHGIKLFNYPAKLNISEERMTKDEILELATSVIFRAIIRSLTKLNFAIKESSAKICAYYPNEFYLLNKDEIHLDIENFLF